jgi:hypothetical protein
VSPSADYDRALAEATAHHARSKTYSGRFLRPLKPYIVGLSERLGCASALDFGAGKGEQYRWIDPADGLSIEGALGFPVTKYDPAWPPFAAEPVGQFDLVICTYVLGCIPLADLGWVMERIYSHATRAVLFAERVGAVKKKVISAHESHPIGWSADNWLELFQAHLNPAIETHFVVRTEENGERETEFHVL